MSICSIEFQQDYSKYHPISYFGHLQPFDNDRGCVWFLVLRLSQTLSQHPIR
ncbi:hypothetical protein MTR_5g041275 [Medicago truncatula]|uniref:Uncharacterized protein n=1 Tax=Medicago truncatula TaxID=3880 RepID=A0A072UFD8_MEDTR|nr:hypothetical protein MTR_5g041275 [Medicago truncatula]